MNVKIYKEAVPSFDAAVIPFSDEQLLSTELPEVISVPAVKELPLTLECRVVCVEKQDTDTMPEEILKEHYPSEKPTPFGGSLENYHYAFYGQIVSAYMIED